MKPTRRHTGPFRALAVFYVLLALAAAALWLAHCLTEPPPPPPIELR